MLRYEFLIIISVYECIFVINLFSYQSGIQFTARISSFEPLNSIRDLVFSFPLPFFHYSNTTGLPLPIPKVIHWPIANRPNFPRPCKALTALYNWTRSLLPYRLLLIPPYRDQPFLKRKSFVLILYVDLSNVLNVDLS